MTRNLGRLACRVLSGYCFLAATTLTIHAQPLTFTTFAGPLGSPGSGDATVSLIATPAPSLARQRAARH